jgi:uncharacterized membrane protein
MNLLHNAPLLFASSQVITGLIQVAVSFVLVVMVVLITQWSHIAIGKETALSLVRGFVQMILVGIVLALIMQTSPGRHTAAEESFLKHGRLRCTGSLTHVECRFIEHVGKAMGSDGK